MISFSFLFFPFLPFSISLCSGGATALEGGNSKQEDANSSPATATTGKEKKEREREREREREVVKE